MTSIPRSLFYHLSLAVLFIWIASWAPVSRAQDSNPVPATAAEKTIAVESGSGADAKIRSRLLRLFSALDGLAEVKVDVSGGVVALSGEVPTSAAHEQAMRIVRRIDGVAEVRDQISVSRNLSKRLGQLQERVTTQFLDIFSYLPLFAVAAVVLAVFWWVSGLLTRSEWLVNRFGRNPFIRDLVRQVTRLAILGLGVLIALEVLDASTLFTSLLGAAGVVGLAVGFALRDTVENYIASLLLSLRQPFARDDLVAIEGSEGRVVRLNARATVLLTPDGNHVRIPNARVYTAAIVNYTRNPKRRFEFDVSVGAEQNVSAAQRLAATTLCEMEGVQREPAPMCIVETLGESNVVLRVYGWVNQGEAEFMKVRSEAIHLVKGAFERAGVVKRVTISNVHTGRPVDGPTVVRSAPMDRRAGHEKGGSAEPQAAIDVERRADVACQVDDVRSANEEDLLHSHAARE